MYRCQGRASLVVLQLYEVVQKSATAMLVFGTAMDDELH